MIKRADLFTGDVLEKFFPPDEKRQGFGLRWEKTGAIWFGRGEMSVWTGYNGHGKSMFLNQIMLEAIIAGEKVDIGSYEMTPARTLQRMVKQALGKSTPNELEISECLEWLGKSIGVHAHLGQVKLAKVLEVFKKRVEEHGVTQIVIDSLMKLGMAEDDYNGQKVAADQLQSLAQKTGCHVHLVAHPRKGLSEAEIPGKMDIAGSGSISNMADNVFSVWRNKLKWEYYDLYESGDSLPKNMTIEQVMKMMDGLLFCSKCREDPEAEKKYSFYYLSGCMQYHDVKGTPPYSFYQEGQDGRYDEFADVYNQTHKRESGTIQNPLPIGIMDKKTQSSGLDTEADGFSRSGYIGSAAVDMDDSGYFESLARD